MSIIILIGNSFLLKDNHGICTLRSEKIHCEYQMPLFNKLEDAPIPTSLIGGR